MNNCWHVVSRSSATDVLPALCIITWTRAVSSGMPPSGFGSFWAEVNNSMRCQARMIWAWRAWVLLCGRSYSPKWSCCFGAFQHYCQEYTAERKGCTSLEGTKEHSYIQLWPKPFLLGLVMLWVFWRIGFNREPEWTFLAFFPFCHPACFRKSPDVGVCILSLSSLTVLVFQAWQQWKET